jgi:SAM-dependent methyltransferase
MERWRCIACGDSSLHPIVDLGMHPFADRFVSIADASAGDRLYPLTCDLCGACGHIQARTMTNPDDRYSEYSYTSSNSATSRSHWDSFAREVASSVGAEPGGLVVEAGSNDGYLCRAFNLLGFRTLGVDPSDRMCALAASGGVRAMQKYFTTATAERIASVEGRATLVVANNVLNHADDLRDFVRAARTLLSPTGTFVVQVPYWRRIAESAIFDQVYHEHVSHFTVMSLDNLFRSMEMHVESVNEIDYHGRSLRVFAKLGAAEPSMPVAMMIEQERAALIHSPSRYPPLMARATAARWAFLQKLYARRGPVVCAGASAKGNTFLNWHRLDRSVIDFVTDVSPTKVGKLTPGTRIHIYQDDLLAGLDKPRVIVTSWNLAGAIRPALMKINDSIEFLNPYEGLS